MDVGNLDREQLCESLITWLQTFGVTEPNDDLSDGVAMAKALNQIGPEFFNNAWMSKVKEETTGNWRLKVSNLKKVLRGIQDYYSEVLGQHIQNFIMPDVTVIGETGDRTELSRLLQLILGCAVNCDNKQRYIEHIMSLEESIQHMVMMAIQELISKEAPASGGDHVINDELAEQIKCAEEQLQSLSAEKDDLAQRCHELDQQVAALQEERTGVIMENERLTELISVAENLEDPSTPAGRRHQQLQSQATQLQEELYRVEAAKDDYRIKLELQERELTDLHIKNEELQVVAREVTHLKDEVDVLRMAAEKATKYEASIESYKKKLEELSDYRSQVKMLEEKNTSYMQSNLEMEEELKKSQNHKSQMDVYKRNAMELQMKLDEEMKRGDKFEFEADRALKKLDTIQREKEKLIEERDSLKDLNEELSCSQIQKAPLGYVDSVMDNNSTGRENEECTVDDASPTAQSAPKASQRREGESGSFEMPSLPPSVKEQLLRLQHENKKLKMESGAGSEEECSMLKDMLDTANSRINDLQSDNRILNKKTLELEATIEDLTKASSESESSRSSDHSELAKKLAEQQRRLSTLEESLSSKQTELDEALSNNDTDKQIQKRLEEKLKSKEEEMKMLEERYRGYLEKARSLMKGMSAKANANSNQVLAASVQTLRAQLKEKDKLIRDLQNEQDKAKEVWSQEEKLMTTAWHNLSAQLQMNACDERLSNVHHGQSFLARQRQAHTLRTHSNVNGPSS